MSDPPDAFAAVAALIALVADPKACAVRLAELQKQADAAATAQRQLSGARSTHEAAIARAKAAMDEREAAADEREKKLRRREVAVGIAERDIAEREKAIAASRPPRYPQDPNMFGSIVREPYHG
jgi:hypothetical protein